ncbi:putative F-box domain, galactose oxidase/kelch, beta-propeller, F-box associated interaction [Rosa chinensis]|uniref:Putative F-box domain, galactose oxidase/kelch, beta-propeller, F-box associated interaction n=1 Tax=Rosa chinensis TaxID=74649 RepID=A0A2P6RV09_ROSCH|nr:F-box/kelch-repeat protein At3g23880 [Rosa chinensis]PRQ50270.1 putative F-box domain, galactose oxidase/kelch, beta-propeller, F-box associated interaction [Rosa chinensis]
MSMEFSPFCYLPEEMMMEILLRLPIKSILQSTSVCKPWNSLIKRNTFIKKHLKLTSNRISRDGPLLLLRHCPREPNVEQYSLHLDNHTFQEYSKPQLPAKSFNECFRIVGSCNGLILLSDDYLTETNTFILWNPSIRKSITLPKPHIPHSQYHTVYGFGFDAERDDYKIVKMVYEGHSRASPEVELYSLNSRSWRSITAASPKYEIARTMWSQVFVNGFIHFIGYCMEGEAFGNVVLGFDVCEEVFHEIKLPKDLASEVPNMVISVIGKSLAVQHYDSKHKCCNVWVMREYGVVESWTKQCTIDFLTQNFRVTKVLGSRKNGEFLLETYEAKKGEIVLHDPKKNTNEHLGIYTEPGYTSLEYYTESLVLLDQATSFADSMEQEEEE